MATVVKYGDIENSCKDLENLAANIETSADALKTTIDSIATNWQGTAGDNYHEKISAFYDDIVEAKQTIAMSVLYLASCAGAYEEMDRESMEHLIELIGGQEAIDNTDVSNLSDPDLYARIASQFVASMETGELPLTEGRNNTEIPSGGKSNSGSVPSSGNNSSSGASTCYPAVPFVSTDYSPSSGARTDSGIQVNTSVSYSERQKIEIPNSVTQGGYTVTGYDKWINSGKNMEWKTGTTQRTISELWQRQGCPDEDGIATVIIDGVERYLVALSPKYGKVGDLVDIELENGQIIKAVIADTKGDDAGSEWGHRLEDGSINILEFEVKYNAFVVEHNRSNPTSDEWGLDWESSSPVKSITNQGTIADSSGNIIGRLDENSNVVSAENTISGALEWAAGIANDNSHGYSQASRQGPDYDCSSFVINAYRNAGANTGSASYTGNMIQGLTSTGEFEYVAGNPYQTGVELRPGDLLFRDNSGDGHTEMYFGDGQTVGAHSNYDGRSGDSAGSEINIQVDTGRSLWQGFFRYVPKTKIV